MPRTAPRTKKVRCPLCGSKNEESAPRCRTCTRPLARHELATQNQFTDALWSTKIATPQVRTPVNPLVWVGLVLVTAVIGNYFVLKQGPSWAHEPKELPRDFQWKEYRDNPAFAADLPGTPIRRQVPTSSGTLDASTVWVDSNWNLLRDTNTQSAMAIETSLRTVHATLTLASGPAAADVEAAFEDIVAGLGDGARINGAAVTEVNNPTRGKQYSLRASFTGAPEPSSSGIVRAQVTVLGDQMFVATSFVQRGDDGALMDRLGSTFIPAASQR